MGGLTEFDYEMDSAIVDHVDYRREILSAMKAIPSLSIVMDKRDLFGQVFADDGELIGMPQRYGPFSFVVNTDKISRENIEFIRGLFPSSPLYTCMLPAKIKAQIGQVGEPTLPVKKMLSNIGFQYDYSIDPFDGGPTYKVKTEQCVPVTRSRMMRFAGWLGEDEQADGVALVVAPIAFVSEHSETLVELDITYRDVAAKAAVPNYHRVPALGVNEAFIAALAELVQMPAMADVNFTGLMRVLGQVVPGMVDRDAGHIVITGYGILTYLA